MTEKELLAFIQKILLQQGSHREIRASGVLLQLKDILVTQGTDPKLTAVLTDALSAMPELQKLADEKPQRELTGEDIRTAARRKEERLAREREMRSYGRC